MTVEIRSFEIEKEKVTLEAVDIDALILAEDLFADIGEEKLIKYQFDRKINNGAQMKYLYKICASNKKAARANSFGAKLQTLLGQMVYIPESFRV